MIIQNDGGNNYKSCTLEKNPWKGGGSFQGFWMSSLQADNLDDEAHVPTTTATPTIEMDGEEGENTTTDEITNTGV